jgi:NAD(P)-dependent dehydrogenase (short-subunit alcohol dehydrogenase family)
MAFLSALGRVLLAKWLPPALPPAGSFTGQTILITGATGGLGLEAAIQFVNLGAKTVIITGRSASKARAAKATIEQRTGKTGVIQVRELDMSTFAGVKRFVDELIKDVESIDVVLLNAGLFLADYHRTADGWEETIQVNTLSTVLLGLLLLPWLQEMRPVNGKPLHLGFVGSGMHLMVDVEAPDFPKEGVLRYWSEQENFRGSGTYAMSKLFLQYGVDEIVKLAKDEDGKPSPIINTMCPGLCKSDLGRAYSNKNILYKIGAWLFYALIGKTTEAGARTFVLASMTGPIDHGRYIQHYGTEEDVAE